MISECSRPLMLKPCEGVVRAANLCRVAVDWPILVQEISLYFFVVTQARKSPYCCECMITLVKADKFPVDVKSRNLTQHFRFSVGICSFIYCLSTSYQRVPIIATNK